jgi:HD-like signal output (HDOD) protein
MNAETRTLHGESAAESRREAVLGSAAALAASVNLARPFPQAAAKVLTLTSGQDFDVPALVAVLESDLALSTRILRLVNSPRFGLRVRCATVKQAVPLLGSEGVRLATVAGSVLNLFPGNGKNVWRDLHNHATLVGGLCRHLAPQWGIPEDEMFTAAFLHDIGKWIFLEREPGYAAILETADSAPEATVEKERAMFGFDHAELAGHLLSAWGIPNPLPEVVGLHHDPATAYAGNRDVGVRVALIRMADQLAHSLTTGKQPDFEALAKTEPFTYLGLSAKSVLERFGAFALLFVGESDEADESSERPADRAGDAFMRPISREEGRGGSSQRRYASLPSWAWLRATHGYGGAVGLVAGGILGSAVAREAGIVQFLLPLAVGVTAGVVVLLAKRG